MRVSRSETLVRKMLSLGEENWALAVDRGMGGPPVYGKRKWRVKQQNSARGCTPRHRIARRRVYFFVILSLE